MDRDEAVLMERIGGATLREVGEAHSLTPEGVRHVFARTARRHVDSIVLAMWAAQKTGELVMLAVPAWVGADDQRRVVGYLDWLLGEFSQRDDVDVKVRYVPTPGGSFAFALEDVSFNPKENER